MDSTPAWKRIMEGPIFEVDVPCVVACFIPCIMMGYTTWKVTNNLLDGLLTCLCLPCCCIQSRAAVGKALGADLSKESCIINCALFWFCACFMAGQQYKAVDAWLAAGNTATGVSPSALTMGL